MHVDLLIDANSLYARSFYGAEKFSELQPPLAGVHQFIKSTIGLISPTSNRLPETPTRLLFAWDFAPKSDKKRGEKPPEYYEGIDILKENIPMLFGAAQVNHTTEADDLVATATYNSKEDPDVKTIFVASGDKDLKQVADNVKVFYYYFSSKAILTQSQIKLKHGVKRANQIAIALALLGDAVDGIKGVTRFGPKKVKSILALTDENSSLTEDLNIVLQQLDKQQTEDFLSSLELTLLDVNVANVPTPNQIVLEHSEVLEQLGFSNLIPSYTLLNDGALDLYEN